MAPPKADPPETISTFLIFLALTRIEAIVLTLRKIHNPRNNFWSLPRYARKAVQRGWGVSHLKRFAVNCQHQVIEIQFAPFRGAPWNLNDKICMKINDITRRGSSLLSHPRDPSLKKSLYKSINSVLASPGFLLHHQTPTLYNFISFTALCLFSWCMLMEF